VCDASSTAPRDARVINLLDFVARSSHLDVMGRTGTMVSTVTFAWKSA